MGFKTIALFFGTLIMTACSSDTPKIRAACGTDMAGLYTVKWEVFPMKTGKVKIFESKQPDHFEDVPVDIKNISDGFAIIPHRDNQRHFFKLVFNNKYTSIVGERHIITERIDNFRDLGGYYKGKIQQIKWGKIYRSGSLSWLSSNDKTTLDSLHIQTVLDLRNANRIKQYPNRYQAPHMENMYLQDLLADSIRNKIIRNQMMKGDVLISLQDMYAKIIDKDTLQLEKVFNILLEEKNYPVLINCSLGKDRTGLVSVLILEALGIDREQILYDYMLSNNKYINFNRAVIQAPELPAEAQEALTTFLSANESVFNFIYEKMEMDYGSVNNYLEKKLNLTDKKREKLQEILLY